MVPLSTVEHKEKMELTTRSSFTIRGNSRTVASMVMAVKVVQAIISMVSTITIKKLMACSPGMTGHTSMSILAHLTTISFMDTAQYHSQTALIKENLSRERNTAMGYTNSKMD